MAVLVCGGAGYIGSHTTLLLKNSGQEVVVADNLSRGHRGAVKGVKLMEGDLRDSAFLDRVFTENKIESVIHFAAESQVGESVVDPLKYYNNNLTATQSLLGKMKEYGVFNIVFSSTAATYGEPENIPILESDRTLPTNPYGETKLSVEKMLKWCDNAYGIKYVALRYFNAAGADINGEIGEDHAPETHLIPLVLQAALGNREYISVFGNDYNTPDGSCIRDYIHVTDLGQAHILALEKLQRDHTSATYNLGNGKGFSVLEVIKTAEKVVGHAIPQKIEARRAGDPATLIASSEKIMKELNWQPKYNSLETIIETAWNWHKNHPNGFGDK